VLSNLEVYSDSATPAHLRRTSRPKPLRAVCAESSYGCPMGRRVSRGDVQDVRNLLDQGADVHARNRHGQTALMLAAHTGHRQAVAVLVAHRANLNTTAKYGLSALMLALVAGYVEVARLLADAGTDLSLGGTGGGLHWQDGLRSCS
jgi:predicted LPLAT superfamily acyltransferase